VVTHPEAPFIRISAETQSEIVRKGVFFERCYVDTTVAMDFAVTVDEITSVIRKVGVESTILTSDFGSALVTPPVEGMREYLTKLTAEGFNLQEIRHMAGENPALLLDL
jgi:predicted metal-dependent TIM-barrel fold hydrolase